MRFFAAQLINLMCFFVESLRVVAQLTKTAIFLFLSYKFSHFRNFTISLFSDYYLASCQPNKYYVLIWSTLV